MAGEGPKPQRRRLRITRLALACSVVFLLLLGLASTARAAPEITLDKQAPGSVLFGNNSTVTLHVANPQGEEYGYNLSLRDVLPEGVSYVEGSAPVEPTRIAGAPEAGKTTLIFENVSDLSGGSSYELEYEVSHEASILGIGDVYTNEAGAYINDDPRLVPDFGPDGTPSGEFTGSATDTAETEISAIEIVKHEQSPEGEILRGAHDHQKVYTLTVRSNAIEPTAEVQVEDWLPAGLEFLGCGEADNTNEAPTNEGSPEEYAGSGTLNPGNAPATTDCVAPARVETVDTDPDGGGPLASGVYTHVVWSDLGEVEANGEIELQYVAAVPLQENTMSWPGGAPAPAGGTQASNLDNNSGAETFDEQSLTNYASVEGQYEGAPVEDSDALTRSAEDLAVRKTVDEPGIAHGQISTWSLTVSSSEYRYVEDIRVDDTLPDGLCPLGVENHEDATDQTSECNPTGDEPTHGYSSVIENEDGTYAIAWNESTVPELEELGPSSTLTISFPTRTRADYQESFVADEPVLAQDSWVNAVSIAGADYRICAPADPLCDEGGAMIDGDEEGGTDDTDASSAEQRAEPLSIDKQVRERAPIPVDCATGAYVDTAPSYGPGDRICWELRIDFPGSLDSGTPELTDFLPPGVSYVPGSAQPITGENTVTASLDDEDAGNGVLSWDLGGDVPPGDVFAWRFETDVEQTLDDSPGDIQGNLMKLTYENTEETSFPQRDEADFVRSAAVLDLSKGVLDVDDDPVGSGPDVDGVEVAASNVVTFRIDVSNEGDLDAADGMVWDELEDGIDCEDVSEIDFGGSCSGTRIEWTELSVPADEAIMLTYDVTIPPGVEPGRRFDDRAGVVSYTSATNTEDEFTYVPEQNIDSEAPEANAPAADDDSSVHTAAVTLDKLRATGVDEPGNSAGSQATIGEQVDYSVELVVPEGTTIYGSPALDDDLGGRQTYVEETAEATLNGGALPAGFALEDTGNVVSLQFPESYENEAGSGDDTFVVAFSATVEDVAANTRTSPGHQLPNTATFSWEYEDGSQPPDDQDSVTTTIVEPDVAVAKADDDEDGIVSPEDVVEYTLTASNSGAARVSTAHDLQLVDVVPAGLAPVLPIAGGGEWDEGERSITWDIASMDPGEQQQRSYSAEVVEPATAGEDFTNEVELTATSMAGPTAGERDPEPPVEAGYVAEAEDTLQLGDATLVKEVSPGSATIGEQITYTAEVVFPPHITYDDATVIDTLPDGLVYDETVEVSCSECTPPAGEELGEESGAEGSTTIGWFLDDLPAQETARTYEITYRAHLAGEYADGSELVDGEALANSAEALYNGSDEIEGTPESIPDPESFDSGTSPDEASVEVVEPELTIDKGVSGDGDEDDVRPTEPGDTYTYSLTTTNTGSSPAYDVEVTDTPDIAELDEVEALSSTEATLTDPDASDGDLGWTIPGPIEPEGSVTVEYTAALAPSEDLEEGDAVQNTATVERFWGIAEAERDDNPEREYRSYSGPQDDVTLTVHLPQLEIEKTTGAESEVAEVGEPFSWRLELTNQSTYAATHGVELRDVLPPNWTYIDGSAVLSPGGEDEPELSPDPEGDRLTWEVGDLEPEDQVVVTFEARPTAAAVDDPGSGESSPNVNEARASGVDSGGASASAEGPYADEDEAQAVLTLPQLAIQKTPDGEAVNAGEDAFYEIEVANEGEVPARDVVVTDVLEAGQDYTAESAEATPDAGFSETSVSVGPGAGETTIEWRIAEIPAEAAVTIELPVATDAALDGEATLDNDASVVSREITSPESDEGSLEVEVDADLAILKQAQEAAVNAGEEMDFELEVTNEGPSDATGVEVEDVLPANLDLVSADPACEDSGGTVDCTIGTLEAEESVSLAVRVEVDSDVTEEVANTATVGSESPDSNDENDESTATKPVDVAANLVMHKQGPEAPILKGSSFDYTVVVENAGVSAAVESSFTDPLPPEVGFVEAIGDGSCEEADGTLECSFGTLEPGEQVEVTLRGTADDVGAPVNEATASTQSSETPTADNEDDAPVEILPSADLAVSKSAPASVGAGEELPYLLEVINNGPSEATGVTLADTLPPGVEVVSSDPACSHAGRVLTCAVAGQLDISESRSYALTVSVPYALGGSTLTNSVTIDGNEGDPVTENDSTQTVTEVGPAADLAISKTAGGATAGSTGSWTIAVENRGPSAAPATVTDELPDGTSLSATTPSQGDCEAQGDGFTCDLGTLAAGASAQVTAEADVAADAAGKRLRNRAAVEGTYPDPDPSNDEAEAESEVAEPESSGPDLTLTKTAGSSRPRLGKAFGYRLLVRNVGDANATRVKVTDTPSKALRVRRAVAGKGRCSARGTAIRCSLGTLAAGEATAVKPVVVPLAPGWLRNTASASSSGPADVDAVDNTGVAGVEVRAPRAGWALAKRATRRVVRGGQKVRFTLRLRVGRRAVAGARVCDVLPRGLVFVRAPGARFRNGKACWRLGYLAPRTRRALHVVARAERGFRPRRVRNVAVAGAANAQRRAGRAGVLIRPAFGGAPGGVTG